jgi:uncharacterized protein (DUF39 family)
MKKYKVSKTYQQINDKIRSGEVVVVTAEEMVDIVKQEGRVKAAKQVDVVTTGTFAPMCSSGAFINFGHSVERPSHVRTTPSIRFTLVNLTMVADTLSRTSWLATRSI